MEVFPKIDLFPRITKVVKFIFGHPDTQLHMSNHYNREHFEPTDGEATTGAAFMLDAALDQPQLPFDESVSADFYPPFIDRSRV